ncbi:MAG: aldehyde dehydrogenase family protein, partial [Mesorhizobium sp.]
ARHAVLRKASDEITARKDEIGRALAREEGKTLVEGVGETVRAAQIFDFFAGEALRLSGEQVPSVRPGVGVEITREAVGVVGIITPWNFPSSMLARKLGPALAAGCTAVVKPASQTPYSGLAWGALAEEVGFPKGVINILTGAAGEIGDEI